MKNNNNYSDLMRLLRHDITQVFPDAYRVDISVTYDHIEITPIYKGDFDIESTENRFTLSGSYCSEKLNNY